MAWVNLCTSWGSSWVSSSVLFREHRSGGHAGCRCWHPSLKRPGSGWLRRPETRPGLTWASRDKTPGLRAQWLGRHELSLFEDKARARADPGRRPGDPRQLQVDGQGWLRLRQPQARVWWLSSTCDPSSCRQVSDSKWLSRPGLTAPAPWAAWSSRGLRPMPITPVGSCLRWSSSCPSLPGLRNWTATNFCLKITPLPPGLSTYQTLHRKSFLLITGSDFDISLGNPNGRI